MKSFTASLFVAVVLFAAPALAMEKHGVRMPDTTTVEGQQLKLQGMGLRKKWMMDIYVAGLYLSNPSESPLADQLKQVKLVVLRDLGKDKVGSAIREGFEKNPENDMAKLEPRLNKMINALADVKKGESLVLTYDPKSSKTTVTTAGKQLVTIDGKDFGKALFAVWLGNNPVDEGLKEEMLGRKE